LPRLRQQLGASASDEDLLLAAFYDRSFIDALQPLATPPRLSTTPLMELLRFVESRNDLQRASVRYAGAEITLSG
jgi:oxaloacetate decarboxylase alpha subunit